MKSRRMVLSGAMMRSTEEWLISRSCQRAMFSMAARALPAEDAGEPGEVFAEDGVAFVGHGGGAFLPGAKEFFGLPDLRALEMADLHGDFFHGAADEGQGGENIRRGGPAAPPGWPGGRV